MHESVVFLAKMDDPAANLAVPAGIPASLGRRARQHELGRALALAALRQLGASGVALSADSPPRLLGTTGRARSVSISHRGSWVAALASSAEAAGVDLEVGKARDYEAALELFLSAPEQAWLQRRSELTAAQRFYRAWTLKEALGKRAGRGWDSQAEDLDLVRAAGGDAPFGGHLEWPERQLTLAVALSVPHSRLRLYDCSAGAPRLLGLPFLDWRAGYAAAATHPPEQEG
ncbi:4'-phosphopantetheinyl transferase superfamily protein [Pseudogulbenkiania sp. MAI-1]|uniref:4'-phosphopantetheinyl transferase family protein n=1 Tax=Pseudogulbenkiania sp. MAI-1 TaxID=990370 RepID=UPI00045E6501|nr:4'-phosphopantetheinyl transferase family protein [Pseudogulbenkiania sp. MAI-1]